ncbi:MAG: 4Fe-4S binding protein [Deltaproteobacteria bacterium]|nr:4Fe-4S binding protein [Deltaproteobacteria bacterium]
MNRFLYLKNVATLTLESEKCTGCGMCLTVCPHAVFSRNNGIVRIEHRDACMECGACAKNCPVSALFVNIGVGCAAAVINAALGRKSSACCCVIEEGPVSGNQDAGSSPKTGCC